MSIQLNPEQERIVDRAMRAGLIRSLDDVVEVGIAAIRSRLNSRDAASSAEEADEWLREFTTWIEGHSTSTPPLPEEALNRDSIYGSCGL
jgi:Arc/MetJ-type ribon-helix-helix transcriptional regulator